MLLLQVRHHEASIQVTVKLSRFIADWPAAQQLFIGGLADRFHDWHSMGPENFSITPALSLGICGAGAGSSAEQAASFSHPNAESELFECGTT